MPKQLVKFATILVLILLSTSLNAQVDTTKADKGVNIDFLYGYGIAYKWNASQAMSYRVYLNLYSSLAGDEYDVESIYSENPNRNSERTENNKYINMNLSFQFLFNIISQKSFNLYMGIGPNLNYSYQKYEYTNIKKYDNQDFNYSSEAIHTSKSYGVGIISLVGIEAYISGNVTLFAETHLTGVKSWSDNTDFNTDSYNDPNSNTSTSEHSYTGSGWKANLQLVKVGLGIYF